MSKIRLLPETLDRCEELAKIPTPALGLCRNLPMVLLAATGNLQERWPIRVLTINLW